jgi:hypothetical protein
MQIDFRLGRVFWTKARQVNNRCRENGLNYEWPKWLLTLKYWECNFHFIPNNVQNAAYQNFKKLLKCKYFVYNS